MRRYAMYARDRYVMLPVQNADRCSRSAHWRWSGALGT